MIVDRARGWLQGLAVRVRYNRRFCRHPGVLRVTEEGVTIERYRLGGNAIVLAPARTFPWRDVRRILGFKRDAYGLDLICFLFELPAATVEVTEDMEGYNAFVEALPRHFPGLESSWWSTIAFPAFKTNLTTIWNGDA